MSIGLEVAARHFKMGQTFCIKLRLLLRWCSTEYAGQSEPQPSIGAEVDAYGEKEAEITHYTASPGMSQAANLTITNIREGP